MRFLEYECENDIDELKKMNCIIIIFSKYLVALTDRTIRIKFIMMIYISLSYKLETKIRIQGKNLW